MPADKTLLSVTLAATFAAGCFSGYAARDQRTEAPFQPKSAKYVYAKTFAELRTRGYDEQELADAVRIHQAYLDAYGTWWNEFLDAHRDNFAAVDAGFERERDALEARFQSRRGEPK